MAANLYNRKMFNQQQRSPNTHLPVFNPRDQSYLTALKDWIYNESDPHIAAKNEEAAWNVHGPDWVPETKFPPRVESAIRSGLEFGASAYNGMGRTYDSAVDMGQAGAMGVADLATRGMEEGSQALAHGYDVAKSAVGNTVQAGLDSDLNSQENAADVINAGILGLGEYGVNTVEGTSQWLAERVNEAKDMYEYGEEMHQLGSDIISNKITQSDDYMVKREAARKSLAGSGNTRPTSDELHAEIARLEAGGAPLPENINLSNGGSQNTTGDGPVPGDPDMLNGDEFTDIPVDSSGGIPLLMDTKLKPGDLNMNASKFDMETNRKPTNAEYWRERGIELADENTKPYDGWDYIRDMSAGLLASDDESFFKSLGQASLLSNKNRAAAELRESTQSDVLAVKRWENEEKIKAAKLQQESVIEAARLRAGGPPDLKLVPGTSSSTTTGGVTVTRQLIAENSSIYGIPPENLESLGNGRYNFVSSTNDRDHADAMKFTQLQPLKQAITDKVDKPDTMRLLVDAGMQPLMSRPGFMEGRLGNREDTKELIGKLHKASFEGADKLAKLLEDGDGEDAATLARSLLDTGQLTRDMQKALNNVLLSSNDRGKINQMIGERARAQATAGWEENLPRTTADYMPEARDYVLENINWGIPEGNPARYNFDITKGFLDETNEYMGDIFGKDSGKTWLNADWLDVAEFTPNHALKSQWGNNNPMSKNDETPLWNKDQWELLVEEDPYTALRATNMVASIASKLTQGPNRKSKADAMEDVMATFIDANLLRGGDDAPGWDNIPPKFFELREWKQEPPTFSVGGVVHNTQQLREKKILWNGKNGHWFGFTEDGTYFTLTPKEARERKGWIIEDSISLKL